MITTKDIKQRIKSDFGESSGEAFELLQNAINKHDYLDSDRIIRCIIYVANKTIKGLKHSIDTAIIDWRDVIMLAEYVNLEKNQVPKRVRDFNKTFEKCEDDIKE